MKHRIFLLSVVSAALIIFGCGQEGLVPPQLTQSEQGTVLAKATVTSVTATLDITTITSPGQTANPNGVLQIRGQQRTGPMTGGLVGTATLVADFDIVLAKGSGPGRGSFTFAVSPTYQGQFQGQIVGFPLAFVFSGSLQGQGSDGSKLKGTFTNAANPGVNVYKFTGTVLTP